MIYRRLPSESTESGQSIGSLAKFTSIEEVNEPADKALISVLKMITEINRQKELIDYQQHRALQNSIPGYRVRLDFTLHAGWAVEGAIGSRHKLDAAYLSGTVQTVIDMNQLPALYGAPVLMSGIFHSLLSKNAQTNCRLIDSIKFRGAMNQGEVHPMMSLVGF